MVEVLIETPEQHITPAGEAVEPVVHEDLKHIVTAVHPNAPIRAATIEGISPAAEIHPAPVKVEGDNITYIEKWIPPDVSKLSNIEGRKWQEVWKNLRNRIKNAA